MWYRILLVSNNGLLRQSLTRFRPADDFQVVEVECGHIFEELPSSSHNLVCDLRRKYSVSPDDTTSLNLSCLDVSNLYMVCPPTIVDIIDTEEMELILAIKPENRIHLHTDPRRISYLRSLQLGDKIRVMIGHKYYPAKIRWIGLFDNSPYCRTRPGTHFGVEFETTFGNMRSLNGIYADVQYFKPLHGNCTCLFVNCGEIEVSKHYCMPRQPTSKSVFYPDAPLSDHSELVTVHSQGHQLAHISPFFHRVVNERQNTTPSPFQLFTPRSTPIIATPKLRTSTPHLQTTTQSRVIHQPKDMGVSLMSPKLLDDTDVEVGERVVWIDTCLKPQYGNVKWTGLLPAAPHNRMIYVGVEFDNAIGGGTGFYHDRQLFKTKRNHASLVPVLGLVRASDFVHGISVEEEHKEGILKHKLKSLKSGINRKGDGKEDKKPSLSKSNSLQKQFEIGTCVHIDLPGDIKRSGVVRWIGKLEKIDGERDVIAGIELDSMLSLNWPEKSDGTYLDGVRYFDCTQRYGIYVPLQYITIDPRFAEVHRRMQRFGSFDSGITKDFVPPSSNPDMQSVLGYKKGIQGHLNSCYLDATFFAMFAFNDSFDRSILQRDDYTAEEAKLVALLATHIVFPLRKINFVRADYVIAFREMLSEMIPGVQGLIDCEKDPEELLLGLFRLLRQPEPIKYICLSGQRSGCHLVNLATRDCSVLDTVSLPSLQYLLERSLFESGLRLQKAPDDMIIQLPRSGNQRVYDYCLPNLQIDIRHVLHCVSRPCVLCGEVAQSECNECMLTNSCKLSDVTFCLVCFSKHHLSLPSENSDHMPSMLLVNDYANVSTPVVYDLMSCVCIESSHYVTFSRVGDTDKFVFFDSMADRVGEQGGYNIPKVSLAPRVAECLSPGGIEKFEKMSKNEFYSFVDVEPMLKRMLKDSYFTFYKKRRC